MLELFTLIGVIIVAGFLASALFERTRISDALLLMLLGIVVGPVLHLVDEKLFTSAAPFIGTIALIILLFDGGLNLNIFRVIKELSNATAFTFATFFMSVLATGAFMAAAFNWPLSHGMLLGAVVGGTSSSIVIGIVSRLKVSENVKAVLTLESALTDALSIVVAVSILDIASHNSVDLAGALNGFLGAFAIAAVLGFIAAVAWVYVLRRMFQKPYAYMLSLAAIFLLYSFVEAVKSSGAIAVLVFGLAVGNVPNVAERFSLPLNFKLDTTFRAFQTEITFFVRTFFFVYLGTLFNVFSLPWAAWVIAGVALGAVVIARFIGVEIAVRLDENLKQYKLLLTSMLPRGLAAAVLATYPASRGIQIPFFAEAALLIIVATNLISTAGVFATPEMPPAQEGKQEPPKAPPTGSKYSKQGSDKPRVVR